MSSFLDRLALSITWTFVVLLAMSGVLYVFAHAAPRRLVRYNSVPWAFQLHRAWDLRYQAVLYQAFHTRAGARASHASLVWEQPLWCALLWLLHPAAAIGGAMLLLAYVALLRTPWLIAALVLLWASMAGLGYGSIVVLGRPHAATVAMTLLVLGALVRFVGHLGEPLPPGLVARDRFVPIREAQFHFNLVVCVLVGIVSEFAASMPFRLFPVVVLRLGGWLGLPAPAYGSPHEHQLEARRVLDEGWRGSPVTAWMAGDDG
jgi:hypothetical protein